MYDYLNGTIAVRKPNYVVVDVGGTGYRVEIPFSSFEKLPPSGKVKLYTYLKVAEDDMRLFGFATELEREVFLRLVESVPQLGPSKAVAILSSVAVGELMQAVEEGDANRLRRIKGIGPKIANRLVVELKGRLPVVLEPAGKGGPGPSISRDTVHALVSLGYDRMDAEDAVRKVQKEIKGESTVEELLRKCLASL